MRTIISVILLTLSCGAAALEVVVRDGCPVAVNNGSSACPGNPRAACVNNGTTVVWTSPQPIDEIFQKSGTATLRGCTNAGITGYQCVVQGRSGDSLDYGVVVNGCTLDPTIIIR